MSRRAGWKVSSHDRKMRDRERRAAEGNPLFWMTDAWVERRCDVTARGYLECSLPAGHDGEHRAHVSHDLARAYTVIDGSEET